MSPILKIFAGALMMVLGIFTSVTYSTQLTDLILGGIGPLLILLGAFIVWLESDEWKMQKKQQKDQETNQNIQGQQTLQEQTSQQEEETKKAAEEIKKAVNQQQSGAAEEIVKNNTVQEIKEQVRQRNDLDVNKVLQAEQNNQNRKTLVNFLERRVN